MGVAKILVLAIRHCAKLSAPTGITVTGAVRAGTMVSAVYAVARIGFRSIAVVTSPAVITCTRSVPRAGAVLAHVPAAVVHRRIKGVIPEFAMIAVVVGIAPA